LSNSETTNKLIKSRNGGTANVISNYTAALSTWFENPTEDDLRLNASIPHIVNIGTTLGDVTMDIDKTLRPLSNIYDLGAFEYGDAIMLLHFRILLQIP